MNNTKMEWYKYKEYTILFKELIPKGRQNRREINKASSDAGRRTRSSGELTIAFMKNT